MLLKLPACFCSQPLFWGKMFRNVWLRNLRTRTCCRIDRSRTSASMCADCQERYVGWDVDNSGKFAKIDSICEQLKNDVGVIIRLHEGIRVRIRMRQEMLHGCPNLCWKAIPKEASILCPECPTTEEEKKATRRSRGGFWLQTSAELEIQVATFFVNRPRAYLRSHAPVSQIPPSHEPPTRIFGNSMQDLRISKD